MRITWLAWVTIAVLSAPGSAAPLRFCFEDVPQAPWTMPDGSGLNLELLRRAEKLVDEQFVFVAKPWKRCLEETRNGSVDGVVGSADVAERREFGAFPLLANGKANDDAALYQDRANVYLRVGSPASWNGIDLVNPRKLVVAQRGYLVADLLRQRGFQVQDSVKTAEDGLRMLVADVADVAVLQSASAEDLVRSDARFRNKVIEAKQAFVVLAFHLFVNRKVFEANPKRIEAIWAAIATVRASSDYKKLESSETKRREPD